MSERDVQNKILLTCGRGDARLFRNNVGVGWTGQTRRFTRAETVIVRPGDLLIQNPRPLHAGLCEGSSDLIGWRSVEITPDMVGQRIAVFAGIEVKAERGRASEEQRRFIDAVAAAGGIAGVARSPDEAAELLAGVSSPGVLR